MSLARVCGWCRELLSATARGYQAFCSRRCRQSAFRLRRRRTTDARNELPMRFAYADPPYPGLAKRSAAALREVLPLCPNGARVAAWVKPIGASSRTFGIHNTWEPLIVVRGRALRGGVRDWLRAQPARFGGSLPGRKPLSFCAWLFDLLGMLPGDELADLFPGTGVITRAWRSVSLMEQNDASPGPRGGASSTDRANTSPGYRSDGSDGAPRNSSDAASLTPAPTTRRRSTRATQSSLSNGNNHKEK